MTRLHELRRILVLRIRDRALRGELRYHRVDVDRRGRVAARRVVGLILVQLADRRGVERRRLRELRGGLGEQDVRHRGLREGLRARIRRDAGRHRAAQILHARYAGGDRRGAVSVERGLRTSGVMIAQVLHAAALQRVHNTELGLDAATTTAAADRLVTVLHTRICQ